jgi:hypothetical protein
MHEYSSFVPSKYICDYYVAQLLEFSLFFMPSATALALLPHIVLQSFWIHKLTSHHQSYIRFHPTLVHSHEIHNAMRMWSEVMPGKNISLDLWVRESKWITNSIQ